MNFKGINTVNVNEVPASVVVDNPKFVNETTGDCAAFCNNSPKLLVLLLL